MAYRILIVDDSKVTRSVLKKTIGMTDVPVKEIFEAGNGYEALDLLSKHTVDLVLADINMPGMNGMEMAAGLLANPATKNIPVVIVSTHTEDMRINELRSQGVKAYIHKPFTAEMIRDVLNEILVLDPA
ncbi:MAG: response regulator [Sedimentisphaerales bacterium]|nr:response regulator [Sedimentisphaerales bacterium]